MSDPLDPIRDLLARLTRERDEAVQLAARLDRECSDLHGELDAANAHGRRMAAARDELDTECMRLREMVGDRAAE
jgi:predicted translin family RNA/ssDNA-binding protein